MTRSAKVFLGITMVLVALIGVIALSSLAMYYEVSIREANALAMEAYRADAAGDYDVAIAQYSAALRKPLWNQQKALLYTNRGHAYNSKRQFAEAIADHTQAIRLSPKLSYAFAARGYAYQERGELEKALVDLTESIRLDPNSDSAYYNRGLLLNRRGEFTAALIDFNEAVRCSPERGDRLVARALCYFAMDDFDRALANFDGAIATEPSNAIGYLARSNFYARRGNADKQQRDYEQALSLNPNAGNLRLEVDNWFPNKHAKVGAELKQTFRFDNLGLLSPTDRNFSAQQLLSRNAGKTYHQLFEEAQVARDQGNYEDEIALWNDVVTMNLGAIQVAPAIMNRGNAYSAKGDFDKAMQDYNEAINLDPKNAGAYVNRALALARHGDFEAAMKDYAKAIALNPRQWQAYFNRAAELRDSGKLRDAVDDLNEVVKLNPEFVGAYMNRGNIYAREGELEKAIADYSAALQRDSNLTDIYISRAKLFVRKKKYQQAVSDLQTAVQMKTKRPEAALNSLAWLRATCPEPGMRDGKEAVQLAVKACDLSEWKDWGTIDTLAAAYAETGDFDQATNYQQCVLQMVNPPTDQRKLQQRLALYKEHKPYREAANED
jgi:tetratricopeptide (TPR) repeat protein